MSFKGLIFFFLTIAFIGCSITSTKNEKKKVNLAGDFAFQNLKNTTIFKLKMYNNELFAGTSKGLAFFKLSNGLEPVGTFMAEKNVRAFLILSKHDWLVSAYIYGDTTSLNIYKSINSGNTWFPYTNGYGGNRKLIPNTMDAIQENPSVLFARSPGLTNIAKSTDDGKSWRSVNQTWTNPLLGASNFVKIDRNNPNIIWGGGATALFFSSLLKSTDGGKTWARMVDFYIGNDTVWDLIIRTNHSDHILSAQDTGVYKSTDGGKHATTVYQQGAIYTLTHSARDPQVVYASGQNTNDTLFFAASTDFGDTWQTITMPGSPTGLYVNDMVSVMQNGHEVLYLGTNKGVYSYTFGQ